ncbi:protein telomere ends associated isoform X2 [Drosophila bipectinata]|uniref:protein telomere ends associated isoform X2 n=1 Tax=Drosophila bipectinata TaxID=42026 RepID=UPI0038B3D066
MSTSEGKRGTKRKGDSMYPVLFSEFKNLVTNLPDICFELQSEKGAMTLDECAMFFYKQFYENPSIRKKYPVNIKPCPRLKKKKFFSIPTELELGPTPAKTKAKENRKPPETLNATDKNPPPWMVALPDSSSGYSDSVSESTDVPACPKNGTNKRSVSKEKINVEEFAKDVEVNIKNAGNFILPLHRNIFFKYLNQETVLNSWIPKKVKEVMPLAEQLSTVYNEFYIFPFKRKDIEYFVGLPKELKERIFKYGIPIDDKAETTVQLMCPIISLTIFEDHILNLREILAKIKSEDRSGKNWKWADYSQAYYFAFYLNVEIREKYGFKVKECHPRMKDRLLKIPNKATAEFLKRRMPQNLPQINSMVTTTPLPEIITEVTKKDNAEKQITFGLFKRFIKNLDEVILQMQACEKYKNKSEKECAKQLYKDLYSDPDFHKKFECKWKPCPARIRQILLSYQKDIPPQPDKELERSPVNNGIQILEALELTPIPNDVLEKWVKNYEKTKANEPAIEPENRAKQTKKPSSVVIPKTISFKLFTRLIQNLDSIILQMKQWPKYRDKSDMECVTTFYNNYFSYPKFRKIFVSKWKPCPGRVRDLLSSYAVEDKENRRETNHKTKQVDYDVVEDLGFGLFKMPVSFDKFCQCINIDDIVAKLMKTNDKKVIRADLNKYTSYCTDIYTQFFLFPHYRQKIAYHVKTADPEFRKQLEKYAIPMDEKAKSSMAKHSLKSQLINVKGVVYKFPVTFETFIQYINKEDLVVSLIKDAAPTASSKKVAEIQADERKSTHLLRGFYHNFYTSRDEKERFIWSFDGAPLATLAKLHEFAVPILCQSKEVPIDRLMKHFNQSALQRNPPISYQIFECFLDLDVVVKKMQEEPTYAQESNDNCKKIFYREFYNNPRVRLKYPYQIKACPPELLNKILMIPSKDQPIKKFPAQSQLNPSDLKELYAARRQELYSKTLENVRYNLSTHVLHGNCHIPDKPSSDEAVEPPPEENNFIETSGPPASTTKTGPDTSREEKEVSPKVDPVRESLLKEAKEIFFTQSGLEHNLRLLICTNVGLKGLMWRILFQLNLEEFQSYTNIHGGENLYTNETDLKQCYEHVVIKGNWPLNLYVRLSKLRHLMRTKGVEMDTLDLSLVSPKILHWNELVQHTDFDQIVELQYTERTGMKFSDQKTLWQERKQFYAACWKHDEWIYQAPKITDGRLNEMPVEDVPPLVDFVWRPVFDCETVEDTAASSLGNKETINAPIGQLSGALSDHTYSKSNASNLEDMDSDCPTTQLQKSIDSESENMSILSNCSSTTTVVEKQNPPVQNQPVTETPQLEPVVATPTIPEAERENAQEPEAAVNASNFVDVDNVCPATQIEQMSTDPLTPIKQEPIRFLNNLRAAISDSSITECIWESISTELVCLDSDEESDLACFAIPKNANTPKPSTVNAKEGGQNEEILGQKEATVTRKKKNAANNNPPAKRPRLAKDNVPQLRHGFRPLPLSTTDRTEGLTSGEPNTTDNASLPNGPGPLPLTAHVAHVPQDQQPPAPQEQQSPAPQDPQQPDPQPPDPKVGNVAQTATSGISASQDLALGNTLLNSSQLEWLLNANVTLRKVISDNSNNNTVVSRPQPVGGTSLWSHVIFRKLEVYRFFDSLTVDDIIKNQIEGCLVGATYQEALFKFDKRLSKVRGPILETLFPNLSAKLLSDVRQVLLDMKHFKYNSRYPGYKKPDLDLRERVLSLLMDVAPSFGTFHFHFDNASRASATCSKDGREDVDLVKRRSEFNVKDIISPDVLEEMRELNDIDFLN